MTSLSFNERMRGWVSFDERDWNQGMAAGRARRNACAFHLAMEIDDIDRFVADPDRTGTARGWVDCPQLGGRLAVESGVFNLLVDTGREREKRMGYRLFLRDPDGRPLTLLGLKELADDPNYDVWSDTSTLFTRLLAGHVQDEAEGARTIATGILFIGRLDFMRLLASFRAAGGSRADRARALARFGRLFAGGLFAVYGGRAVRESQPSFPAASRDAVLARGDGDWHDLKGRPGLYRRIVPFTAGDGFECNLHHIRGDAEPHRGPVLLVPGLGSRANVFYGAPIRTTLVDALVAEGYDVWVENWRGSVDLPPNPYTLDEAALFDHPPAIETVKRESGAAELKAVVHCQGSTSFTMCAFAGKAPGVTTIVSNAVSLHVSQPLASRLKGRAMTPAANRVLRGVDPQWSIRPHAGVSKGLARWARLVRRECRNEVCGLANYMYGAGPDVLWRHSNLDEDTHAWISREFGYTPFSFFRQMSRCASVGHLVAVDGRPELPEDFTLAEPRTDARFVLLAGSHNRCFLPEGQRRTFEYLDSLRPGYHAFYELRDYSHLDVLFGRDAATDVFPLIVEELNRPVDQMPRSISERQAPERALAR